MKALLYLEDMHSVSMYGDDHYEKIKDSLKGVKLELLSNELFLEYYGHVLDGYDVYFSRDEEGNLFISSLEQPGSRGATGESIPVSEDDQNAKTDDENAKTEVIDISNSAAENN